MSVKNGIADAPPNSRAGVKIGELVGLTNDDRTPLVIYPGQPGSVAQRGRTVVDLSGRHIGCEVVLMFDASAPDVPIVMGVLRDRGWPLASQPAQVQVDANGERMVVNVSEELVLRCGLASITLTRAGKVLVEGTYISHRSSGGVRVKGASIDLN